MRIEERDDGFWVIDGDTETGPYETRAEAMDAMREADNGTASQLAGEPFVALMALEGVETGDSRYWELGAFDWRATPLPLTMQDTSPHDQNGTSYWIGSIDRVWRDEAESSRIMCEGRIVDTAAGEKIAAGFNGVSIDGIATGDVLEDVREVDADGWPTEILWRFAGTTIAGLTVTPIPAFAETKLWMPDRGQAMPEVAVEAAGEHIEPAPEWVAPETDDDELWALFASAVPAAPPRDWFAMPEPEEPCPFTITDSGQVYGHLGLWDSCHVGFPGRCTPPPRSSASYGYFHVGEVVCADGSRVQVGTLTMGTGHENDLRASAEQALAHYDNTGTQVAEIHVVDGQHGPWASGALRPGITPENLRALRASAPSGDWRPIPGRGITELVRVLAVNTPGFPVPRSRTLVASSGQVLAMVAAPNPSLAAASACDDCLEPTTSTADTGLLERDPTVRLSHRIARLEAACARYERVLGSLAALSAAQSTGRVRG